MGGVLQQPGLLRGRSVIVVTVVLAALTVAGWTVGASALVRQWTVEGGGSIDLGPTARVLGMGGAFVALADDQATLFLNPAGLGPLSGRAFSLSHTVYPAAAPMGLSDGSFSLIGVAGRHFGVGVTRLSAQGGEQEMVGTGAVGFSLGPLSLGASGHYVTLQSPTLSGSGITADAGALLILGPLRVGAVWPNLVSSFTYTQGAPKTERASVPTYGAALRLGLINAAVEAVQPAGPGASGWVRAGAELWLGPIGLRAGAQGDQPAGGGGFTPALRTYGATLGLGALRLDYAIVQPEASQPGQGGDQVQSFGLNLEF